MAYWGVPTKNPKIGGGNLQRVLVHRGHSEERRYEFYLHIMWAKDSVCGLAAANVGRVAHNVGQKALLFAANLVSKWGLFAGQRDSYCGPLQLPAARRPVPYIFSPAQVTRLIAAAGDSRPRGSLRPHALSTLIGLLASTGLRAGEAFRLQITDVKLDLDPPQLHILQTKFHKSRIVPLHTSAAESLQRYIERRAQLHYDALSEAFFISERGRALNQHSTQLWFQQLCHRLDLQPSDGTRRPCLTSFRHTFAVTCFG